MPPEELAKPSTAAWFEFRTKGVKNNDKPRSRPSDAAAFKAGYAAGWDVSSLASLPWDVQQRIARHARAGDIKRLRQSNKHLHKSTPRLCTGFHYEMPERSCEWKQIKRLENGKQVPCLKCVDDINQADQVLEGYDNAVNCLVQLESGQLASGSLDGTIKLWVCNEGLTAEHVTSHHMD